MKTSCRPFLRVVFASLAFLLCSMTAVGQLAPATTLFPPTSKPPGPRVGVLSDPERIQFEGLESYTREEALAGLMMTKSFRGAIHPMAPRKPLAGIIGESIRGSLLHAGYAGLTHESNRRKE